MSSPAHRVGLKAAPPARPASGVLSMLHNAIGISLEWGIELLVRLTGKRVPKIDAPWLSCFLGSPGRIGTGIYERIAGEAGLKIEVPEDAGLIPDFNALRGPSFNPYAIRAEIRHFYEHAAQYQLEVWSEVSLTGRFFLWLLVEFISRRMDQLNFPISSLEVAKGHEQRSHSVAGAGFPPTRRYRMVAATEIVRQRHLCRSVFHGGDSRRRKPLRQSHISLPRQRECLPSPCNASRRIVRTGFLRACIWPVGFLPSGGRRSGPLARSQFHHATRAVSRLRRSRGSSPHRSHRLFPGNQNYSAALQDAAIVHG
jgi:hypothetical protein